MSMTRTEIEILIKARNEASGAFEQLNKQIKAVTGESTKATGSMTSMGAQTKGAGVQATAAGVAFGLLAERIGRGLVSAFGETIAAANRLDAGLIGLSSVANAFGQDADRAKSAAQKLASDGLMSVGEAATSLKNLLAAGFGLDQAITLVERFKDTAAFGRQAALGFGQAISSATEGIKNGNSILVDNAGVTKNLSNILVEAGFAATDLSKATSDASVRQALFKGLVKETVPQLGDAARLLKTAAGQQAIFNSQIEIAQAKIGKALQPALADLLKVMIPMVKIMGDNANVLVPLAAAFAAVVIPIAAMKAAVALGLPQITGMGIEMVKTAASVAGSVRSFSDARAAIQLMGEAAGFTFTKMGLLGSAASVASAAFIGWQLGKVINEITGADKALGDLLIRLRGIEDTGPGMSEAEARMKQYLNTLKTAGAIKPPPPPNLDPHVQQFMAMANAVGQSAERIKGWEHEIGLVANAGSLKTLASEIELGVMSTKELSVQFHISEDAVKFYEKKLKDSGEAHKHAAEEAKKHEQAVKDLADQMLKAGVINSEGLKVKLADLDKVLNMAATYSVPGLKKALEELGPEYDALIIAAQASGINVDSLSLNLEGLRRMAGIVRKEEIIPLTGSLDNLGTAMDEKLPAAIQKTIDAYHQFGLKTPEELRVVARETEANYRLLVSQGTLSTKQLKVAYDEMINAQKLASGQLPGVWQKEVVPGIKDALTHMNTAVQGTFAQMLIGAKGFQDGFSDIWKSLKATAVNVMNEILSAFLNQFIKGMLGYLTGQQGAFSQAFSGLFGGGAGGSGAGGSPGGSITQQATNYVVKKAAGYLGIGGAGVAASTTTIGSTALTTGLGVAPSIAGASTVGGIVGGGGAAAGAAGGSGAGAAAGAGAGIGVGSTIAITGGIAGAALLAWAIWKKGLFRGGEESTKVSPARDKWFDEHGGLAGVNQGLMNSGLSWEETEKKVKAVFAAQHMDDFNAAIEDVNANLAKTRAALDDEQAAADAAATSNEALSVTIKSGSAAQTESLKAVVQQLIDMGTLTDANGQKITDMGQVHFVEAADAASNATGDIQTDLESMKRAIDRMTGRNGGIAGGFGAAFDEASQDARNAARAIQDALNGIDAPTVRVPVEWDVPPPPGDGTPAYEPPPDPTPPDAYGAHGVMATKPGIVAFGEGGETELGGPKSFFKDIFQQLGMGNGAGGANQFTFNVTTTSAEGLRQAVEKDIIPMFLDAIRGNRRQARTELRAVAGIT